MKRIAFYINTIGIGGAERIIVNLANSLAELGYETILITSFAVDKEYPVSKMVRRINLEDTTCKSTSFFKRNIVRIYKIREICKKYKIKILISFMAEANARAIIAALMLDTKVIVSVRNDPNREYSGVYGYVVKKLILPFANGCVFQTDCACKYFSKKLQNKSIVILNSVNDEFYRVERKPIPGLIVNCGRLVEQKNHKLLISAFAEALKKDDSLRLEIYGEGPLREELMLQIDTMGLNNKAFLMGITKNVPSILGKASIFVLSSDYEGMPNALMEAMAVGVPCISTDCPCGGPQMLLQGTNNKLAKVGNKTDLKDQILYISENLDSVNFSDNVKERANAFKKTSILNRWIEYICKIENN